VSERRWQSTRANIEAALLGKLDMRSKVEARARAYESAGEPSARPRIECGFDSASGDLVVVVKCSDRVGRLAEILTALSDSGLEIRLAKLDSRADELVDTFYVRRGVEPVGADDLRSLERLIAAGISL
jgi:[protein-PII] uridylyltransferase